MSIEPLLLSSLTASITVLSQEYFKGLASEAGKASWAKAKGLLGWHSDPTPEAIPEKVASGLLEHPENISDLVALLKEQPNQAASSLIHDIKVIGGKVVVAQSIQTLNM